MHNLNKVERIRQIANAKGAEIARVVLAWYLAQQAIDAIIPGVKKL